MFLKAKNSKMHKKKIDKKGYIKCNKKLLVIPKVIHNSKLVFNDFQSYQPSYPHYPQLITTVVECVFLVNSEPMFC